MDKIKYNKIREKLEQITTVKADVDLLASLKTVLAEATEPDGMIKIIVERNKQELKIPALLLITYINERKSDIEAEVDTLMGTVDIT